LPRPSDGIVPKLGFGADLDREVIKQMSCLNATENFIGGGIAKLTTKVISNFSDVFEKLKVSVGGKVFYAVIFKAKSNVTYEKIFHETQFNQSFVLDYDINFGTADATVDSNNPLNATGNNLNQDACAFKKYCGNNYVSQTDKGANLSVKLDFNFTSEYQKNEFKASASAGIANLQICCKPFSASFNASFEKLSESTRKTSSVRLEAIQKGGNVEQLSRILGGSYVFNCSLDNLSPCTQALDAIAQYVASEDFISGVRAPPTVTAYKYCPYSAIYGVPDLPVEVTPEVENARKQLPDKYQELLKDHETVLQTLVLSLSDTRRQQLTLLSTQLENEAEMARQTGENCLNDTSNCPQQAAQVLAGLKAYDRAALHPNPADSLVAYYPFNANALDESGNGNDGAALSR